MSDAETVRIERHTLKTRDNASLSATLYRPQEHNQHMILISGAMGMPQRFYRHYAQYLAENGCVVLTFDFRSMAESRRRDSLWGDDSNLTQWASQDLQATLKWLLRQYPDHQLSVIGHSLGGHLLGAAVSCEHVSSLLGISVQNTYWRNWSSLYQIPMFLFWFILLPMLSHAMGYFPSKWFGLGEPMPKHIALDWSRGARQREGNKGLFLGTSHDYYQSFTGHTCFYSFDDDTLMAPMKAVDDVLRYYPNAISQQRRHICPADIGVDGIGHSRFFRPEMRGTLWQESLRWLLNPATLMTPSPQTNQSAIQPTVA